MDSQIESQHPLPNQGDEDQNGEVDPENGGKIIDAQGVFEPKPLHTPRDRKMRKGMGRRTATRTSNKRGRYIIARPAGGRVDDLALDATIRTAAPFQLEREEQRKKVAFAIRPQDYMRKVRVRRTGNLILFVVDASWSMAVAERMAAAKGAILSLLNDAYQRRDRVGLISFQKENASLILPPTNSVTLAERALEDIPVGGKTPLSAGLRMTYEVVTREKLTHPDVLPLVILLTDGAANVAMGEKLSPLEESYQIARMMAEEKIHSVVINLEQDKNSEGLAQTLAEQMDAVFYEIDELRAESLYQAVRTEIDSLQEISPSLRN